MPTIGPRGWYWRNKHYVCRNWEAAVDHRPWNPAYRPPPPKRTPPAPGDRVTPHNFFTDLLGMFDPENLVTKSIIVQVNCDLIVTAAALERFQLSHGIYPQSLEELTPEFLDSVPIDRYSPDRAQLKYQPHPGGRFTVWSLGPNGTNEAGLPRQDSDQGDIVWQYNLPPNFRPADF